MRMCAIARASAPSVPGRMGMCQSASRAVRVRTGSITTSLAPFLRACSMKGQWCEFVLSVLQAHSTMYFECTKLSGSAPGVWPMVIM